METMKLVREQVSSLLDLDFFLHEDNLNTQHKDDEIARVINGKVFDRTKKRVDEFVSRCQQTLAGLKDRVEQTEEECNSLVEKSNANKPGNPPSEFWLDKSNPNSVANYNEKVERYNNRLELHRRTLDQAERAKERWQDAVAKFNDKKADTDEQIREKMDELPPALDQDILGLLGNLQKVAYDNIQVKNLLFAGFLTTFLSRKVYGFLYERIHESSARQSATQISKQLNDEMDRLAAGSQKEISDGLRESATFLSKCFQENNVILGRIKEQLQSLPYDTCGKYEPEIQKFLATPIQISFDYKSIIDPAEMAKVEQEMQSRKSDLDKQIENHGGLMADANPTFDAVQTISEAVRTELDKMVENKSTHIDPIWYELMFVLSVFDESQCERYLTKHRQWLESIKKEIEAELQQNTGDLLRETTDTELLTKSAEDMLAKDTALGFLSYRDKLARKKQDYVDGTASLSKALQEIGELPKEKAAEFKKGISMPLNMSCLPFLNVGYLFSILKMVKLFMPALASTNSYFVDIRKVLTSKLRIVAYSEFALAVVSIVASFLVGATARFLLYVVAVTYLISGLTLYFKHSQLKKV